MSPSIPSIQQRLTTTSTLILERSRIISLSLPSNPSAQAQIVRNLTSIRSDLSQLSDEAALETSGLQVGKRPATPRVIHEIRDLERGYDSLLSMLGEDKVGEVSSSDPVKSISPPQLAQNSIASTSNLIPILSIDPPTPNNPLDSDPFQDQLPSSSNISTSNQDTSASDTIVRPSRVETSDQPFRDYDSEEEGGKTPQELLQTQQVMMDDQDERLNLLSHSLHRQNHLSIQIGSELDLHHDLLEETDLAMDRTTARLGKAKRRLDKVAGEAKKYGSTVTIVGLIFVLLILIIVFKT
ncbi:hypothetical protein TREMEDRAFT_66698 [Tremella mesenterica DSM 1558]|uniref:uncharacterized protein n=1 Tax=Tremella mesenterica (strain ATCC 24925 / CBS 8224 / DSM 1558 / NBRC 9311 / NRRL Y-6157 / RJB 2259-6 / UBC 559-6) TaxID=578456 RepID=UPI0003F4A235|nr:uncharacterized protein TREMEDRAFT_66698 [Tremella mesenterica DSM 1558]EIW72074.1 hypothetical protein TREMEDRAFT_66698 [Tremella mesenterica DSM 1558]